MKRAITKSATDSAAQQTTNPVEPAKKNTNSKSHASLPLKGGADGASHSRTAKHATPSEIPTSRRTNQRVSATPVE
jgi:hypothetical protein